MSCFPGEIWLQILSNLPPCDLKSACLVSRCFHELAVIYQLMSLDIFIGRFPLPFEREELAAPWQDEKEEAVMNNAWDILPRISGQEKPVLAPIVVGFRVIVSTEHNLVFERHHIRSVLKRMVNLRSFEWTGNPLPLDIAKELVESCPGINTLRLSQLYGSAAEVITGLLRS
ncbi:hypothetical protein DFH11DRAFT_216874 [Phellopilus nigrolimitatus]|nr:hypothetical protein DFH11DRAFT_216874 [Phellopilus nigrolimitatus]